MLKVHAAENVVFGVTEINFHRLVQGSDKRLVNLLSCHALANKFVNKSEVNSGVSYFVLQL